MQQRLKRTVETASATSPPQDPLGRKNSASSRPVAYPPPITTALKASPGSKKRWKRDEMTGRSSVTGSIHATIEKPLECRTAADGVGDFESKPVGFGRD